MERRVDLTARRAARLEQAGEPPVVVVDGVEFVLPVELPLAFVEAFQDQKIIPALRELLGDRAEEFLRAARPSVQDLEEIASLYGTNVGEASASTGT
jgi:hypothetical protein